MIKDYIEEMRHKANPRFGKTGLTDASVARRLAAVSSYFEFARATTHANLRNPLKDFSRKWKKNNDPKPVDEITLDLLLHGITDLRDRTLMTLFVASGLRVSEMHQLNRGSITIQLEVDAGGEEHVFRDETSGFPVDERTYVCLSLDVAREVQCGLYFEDGEVKEDFLEDLSVFWEPIRSELLSQCRLSDTQIGCFGEEDGTAR